MKTNIFILLIFFTIISCNDNKIQILSAKLTTLNSNKGLKTTLNYYDSTRLESIILKNDLGILKIRLPKILDTMKLSIHKSDISSCDRYLFIFTIKINILLYPDTTGEFGPFPDYNDSSKVIDLIISQCMYLDRDTGFNVIDDNSIKRASENVKVNLQGNFIEGRVYQTNIGKGFFVHYNSVRGDRTLYCVSSLFFIGKESIYIAYNQYNYTDPSLINLVKKSIESIKIE